LFSFEPQKAQEFVHKKRAKMLQEKRRAFEKAWHDFDNIVVLITKECKPRRIYQWGSLLNEKYFSEISDIDIAVEGIRSAEQYFEEPCSKLQGMFCLTAVLRSDVRKFAIFRLKPGRGFPVRKKYVFI
jgi:hypothetical protein